MTSDAVLWTYALAPDVAVDPADGGAFLCTATSQTWVETGETPVLDLLAGFGSSEAQIRDRLRQTNPDNAETRCAALLFRLEGLGLLARGLSSRGRRLVSCVPLRPPAEGPPPRPPEGPLRLSPRALARSERGVMVLEAAGSWCRLAILDRDLLPLLHDLAVGRPATDIASAAAGHASEAIVAILALMAWSGILTGDGDTGWACHDLLVHARTRRGYARVLLGKTYPGRELSEQPASTTIPDHGRRLRLEPPDRSRLLAEDPPYAQVAERRRSTRTHGSDPITSGQLSEFLFRTLHERDGRRPYPSGGACYPLKACLAVHRCLGVAPGLYAYDPVRHELITVGTPGPGVDELLADAANAANVAQTPQILLVLVAQYARTHRTYGDLAYSLILKEVGAVFQAAMMAAAAMGLAACPLGCGNSLLLSDLVGVDPLTEASVGEMTLGSRETPA